MKVLFVAAEMAPFAKVGGLADVVGALPKALRAQGIDVRVLMPRYRMIEEDPRWTREKVGDPFYVRLNSQWSKEADLEVTVLDGVPIYLLGTDAWFIHSKDSESLYQPGGDMHLFMCAAVFRACEQIGWQPDVLHAHDWHTGFLPLLLREREQGAWENTASVFTIHNQAYQGEFGLEVLDKLGLPHHLFNPDKVEAWGAVNFLKAGAAYADRVNTVSPTYAKEIQTPEFGVRLEGLMKFLADSGRLRGILNGIDVDVFNPETDPALPANFSAKDPANKAVCRAALREELGLAPTPEQPLLGVVSRLSDQKGMDLMLEGADEILALGAQWVVQGLGDPKFAVGFKALEARYPGQFRFVNAFNAPLAQRIYAGCDGFLMPSHFEPCGLGQLIAMRYGTLPVVRSTGGLADTVTEGVNGFVFEQASTPEFVAAVTRLRKTFDKPKAWSKLQSAGMNGDYTWTKQALEYIAMYEDALSSRHLAPQLVATVA